MSRTKGSYYGEIMRSLKKSVKLAKIKCTVTTADGAKTDTVEATIQFNKLNQLNGNGITAKNLYELRRTGKTVSQDVHGNVYTYELIPVEPDLKTNGGSLQMEETQTAEEAK